MTDFNPDRKYVRRVTEENPDIFAQYPIAQWTPVGGKKISFPVLDVNEQGGNRLVERERPYRNGAKLDDTGRMPTRWSMTAKFENTIQEPGLEDNNANLYPDVLNALITAFDSHERAGDLVVPTRGGVRARLESYTRDERFEERDCGVLQMVFCEDNEDSVNASTLSAPTVSSTAVRLANATEDAAKQVGAWSGSLQDFKAFMSNLEGLANAPTQFIRDYQEQIKIVDASARKTNAAFKKQGTSGRVVLLDPLGNRTERKLFAGSDRAGKARIEARRNQPKLQAIIFQDDQSLMSISAMMDVDYSELLYANPQLPDPFFIPKGTSVNIPNDGTITRRG